MTGWHMRFSVRGAGPRATTTSHYVNNETLKTMCGRNASLWQRVPPHAPDCERCRQLLGKTAAAKK